MSALIDQLPRLRFGVNDAAPLQYAAVPTLKLGIRIEERSQRPIQSVLLDVQIQIAARRRSYGAGETDRLLELFGTPDRWATSLRTLPWTRTTLAVPPFTGSTVADLLIPCTYDL